MTPKKPTLNAARKEWLASLKVGDEVIAYFGRSYFGSGWWQMRVVSTTASSARVKGDFQLHIDGFGIPIGSGVRTEGGKLHTAIYPTSDPVAARELRLSEARRQLHRTRWRDVADDKVERIAAILNEGEKKEKQKS